MYILLLYYYYIIILLLYIINMSYYYVQIILRVSAFVTMIITELTYSLSGIKNNIIMYFYFMKIFHNWSLLAELAKRLA